MAAVATRLPGRNAWEGELVQALIEAEKFAFQQLEE